MTEHIDLEEESNQSVCKNLQSKYKLLNHLDRILEWEKSGTTYPILVNITLTNNCNHKCPLCTSRDFLDKRTLSYEQVKDIILQLKTVGVKAIGLGGGGDPTCHPNLKEVIEFIAQNDLEVSLTTNGQLLTAEIIDAAIKNCTWIRVSLDSDSPTMFKRMHGMDEAAFYQVIGNISKLVKAKRKLQSETVIGVTYLIGSHTVEGVYNATALVKKLGVNYIRIRPFFTWDGAKKNGKSNKDPTIPISFSKRDGSQRVFPPKSVRESNAEEIFKELERCKELEDETFSVSYPKDRFKTISGRLERIHKLCYVHHFTTVISADSKLYPCCMLEDNAKYCLGNLNEKSFKEIWISEERKKSYGEINFSDCPNPCMLEKHNELLWAIKHDKSPEDITLKDVLYATKEPQPHANFL